MKSRQYYGKYDGFKISLQHAADKFISVAQTFHSEAIPFPALRLLGDHEFNDQLLDLERAFLLPPFSTIHYQQGKISINLYR